MVLSTKLWGRRLGDVVRASLGEADFAEARRLAFEGEGETRNLAHEFTFMIRGLAITISVLLDLLKDTNARQGSQAAEEDLKDLLHGFRADVADHMLEAAGSAKPLEDEFRETAARLERVQVWFEHEQGALAESIVEAIDQRKANAALQLIDIKDDAQYLPLHDRLVRFMADSFAWVYRHFGDDELIRFHLATAEGQRKGFEKWEQLPAADFARLTAFLLKQHMGQVAVSEDDEKFTIVQSPCGSGGRLRLNGAYEGRDALPVVDEPGPLTFGGPVTPVYCTHCAIWNGTATLRWFGRAQWVFDQPARADGGCTLHIYKRSEDAPADYADRVGLPDTED